MWDEIGDVCESKSFGEWDRTVWVYNAAFMSHEHEVTAPGVPPNSRARCVLRGPRAGWTAANERPL